MRSKDLGIIPEISKKFFKAQTLEMFRKMCLIKYFELNIKAAYDKKFIAKIPIYLSSGQEAISAALSVVIKEPALFGQHRGHDIYLAFGGDPAKLIDELRGWPTGCAGGMGGVSIHTLPRN